MTDEVTTDEPKKLVFKDRAGAELQRGDFIVYGRKSGYHVTLTYGVVMEITTPKSNSYRGHFTKIRIRGIESWGGRVSKKDSYLDGGDKVLKVIADLQVPPQVVHDLEKALMEDEEKRVNPPKKRLGRARCRRSEEAGSPLGG